MSITLDNLGVGPDLMTYIMSKLEVDSLVIGFNENELMCISIFDLK